MMRVYGLLITKDDHEAFGDWCRDQLALYERVICLDGSESDETAQQAREFSARLIYRHEREFDIPSKTDHGLRRVVHDLLVQQFGFDIWIMCCHTDEFCYHDPRKVAAWAEREGADLVSWYSPNFYPHPSELPDLTDRLQRPVQERFAHYHWGFLGSGLPWIEDRLYKASRTVGWDTTTHGNTRPHGLLRQARFHPIYRHLKVIGAELSRLEIDGRATRYRGHWQHLPHRTGLPFPVGKLEDLFVTSVPKYSFCNRFDGVFSHAWNLGEEYRPDAVHVPDGPVGLLCTADPPVSVGQSINRRPVLAFGPRIDMNGSWGWVGADIAESLSAEFDVRIFDREVPKCDLVVFVKFKPQPDLLREIARSTAVIYCPIDIYGSCREIDADGPTLGVCDRVVIHCERLRKYFLSYAKVEYIDHHVKFSAPARAAYQSSGPILWVGVHTNLPPLVAWANGRHLPEELWVLTNPDDDRPMQPDALGFGPHNRVRIESWSPERQREWTAACLGAIDIKGDDFRARHKPPAKAIDFLASGIPLALQRDSAASEHLSHLGFKVAALDDWNRWQSREYWEVARQFGAVLCSSLSREQVVGRWCRIVNDVLANRELSLK